MSTADILKKFPHLKGFKRKSKAKFENLELRIFVDPHNEDNQTLVSEDSISGEIEEIDNELFSFEKKLCQELEKAIKEKSGVTPTVVFEEYLKLVNNQLKIPFVKALVAEIYSRGSWGSLATIVKDCKKLLDAKTIEFDDEMNLSSPVSYGERRIFFYPKDMSEEFGDASFRVEIAYQENNPIVCK